MIPLPVSGQNWASYSSDICISSLAWNFCLPLDWVWDFLYLRGPWQPPLMISLHLLGPAWPWDSISWHNPTHMMPLSVCPDPACWIKTEKIGKGRRESGTNSGLVFIPIRGISWWLCGLVEPGLPLTPEPLCSLAEQPQAWHSLDSGCGKPLLTPPAWMEECSLWLCPRNPNSFSHHGLRGNAGNVECWHWVLRWNQITIWLRKTDPTQ